MNTLEIEAPETLEAQRRQFLNDRNLFNFFTNRFEYDYENATEKEFQSEVSAAKIRKNKALEIVRKKHQYLKLI